MWIYTVKQNKTKEKQADEISTIINVKREFRRRLNAFTKELWYDQHITSQIFVYMSEWTKKALPIELVILLFTIEIESSFVASLFSSPDDTTSHAYMCSVCVCQNRTHTHEVSMWCVVSVMHSPPAADTLPTASAKQICFLCSVLSAA